MLVIITGYYYYYTKITSLLAMITGNYTIVIPIIVIIPFDYNYYEFVA